MADVQGFEGTHQDMVIRLVLGIARLGEVDLRGWWRSRALSPAGEYILGGTLRRTWVLSALELDVLSAQRRHDQELRRPTALHLFSDQLPFKPIAVSWLLEHKLLAAPNGLADRLRGWDWETARRDLQEWTGMQPPGGEALGSGLRLGAVTSQEIGHTARAEEILRSLAVSYLDQFEALRFPYYDLHA